MNLPNKLTIFRHIFRRCKCDLLLQFHQFREALLFDFLFYLVFLSMNMI